MDARKHAALAVIGLAISSLAAGYRTENFVVSARTAEFAQRVALAAEQYRRELAISWLGAPLPRWQSPCPIQVHDNPTLGAGGVTSFAFDNGRPFGWEMVIQGSQQRILDSVLPHEITHTIFATHFGRPLPRWADEGACTTVEHISERSKQHKLLIRFLLTERGIAFNKMFAMKEYPRDIMPLYAQGYSLTRFLIQQGGRQRFVQFVGQGMDTDNWTAATRKFYGYSSLGELQDAWLEWVKQGSPQISLPIAARPPAAARGSTSADMGTPATPTSTATSDMVAVQPVASESVAVSTGRSAPGSARPYTPGSTGRVELAVRSQPTAGPAATKVPPRRRLTRPQPPRQPGQQVLEWSAGR